MKILLCERQRSTHAPTSGARFLATFRSRERRGCGRRTKKKR